MQNQSLPPILVTGMHRSGTSLVASFVTALGIAMGENLLEADAHNPRGYFEDRDFREFHGRILTDCTAEGDGGHRDWGWTESEGFDHSRLAGHAEAARALVEDRARRSNLWGWKDPRTTLLLDFWDEILAGGARYVLVYRLPWEVADTILRLGGVGGLDIPDYSYRIWAFYDRRLLQFYRGHRDRAVLVSTNALLRDPSAFVDLLQGRLGLALRSASLEEVRDRNLFSSSPAVDPLPRLWLATLDLGGGEGLALLPPAGAAPRS